MSKQITAVELLNLIANHETVTALEYSAEWENGTGYFDGLCRESLEHGKVYSSRDQYGRVIIALATAKGNAVLFQRYTENQDLVTWCGDSTLLRAIGAVPGLATGELSNITGFFVSHAGEKVFDLSGRFGAICQLMGAVSVEE